MESEISNLTKPLILDIGSSIFKLGWAGTDFPQIIAPSIYADITDFLFQTDVIEGFEEIFLEEGTNKYLFGNDAEKYLNILKIHEFKKDGNFSIFLKYFKYFYNQLKIPSDFKYKQPIILINPFFTPEIEKVKYQQIFLETFGFPKLLFLSETQAIISSLKKMSGVIVNIGESNTYISTVLHGFMNNMARDLFPITGKDLTNYFLNLILSQKETNKDFYINRWIAKEIKEKASLCVLNPESERNKIKEGFEKYNRLITLPNNYNLKINYERFQLAEPLFDPSLLHLDYKGLDESIAEVIKLWDRENWAELLSGIIISGGSSLITGLRERLSKELTKYFPEKLQLKVNVFAPAGREHMSWIGASVLYLKGQLEKGWIFKSN